MRSKWTRGRGFWPATVVVAAFALWLPVSWGQQVLRNGFEARPAWIKSGTDVPFEEIAHQMSDQAHDGQRSEYLKIEAKQGSYIHYLYPVGRAPISVELNASLWLKANRPGIQVLAHLVLPNERDPANLDAPLTTMLRGDVYRTVGRWQRLELTRPMQLAKVQQQLMQAQLKRSINFTGAYIDALVLNLYGGPGSTEVWIDDLEIGPVLPGAPLPTGKQVPGQPAKLVKPSPKTQVVEFNGTQLLVGGQPFFFRGIRHTDVPLRPLRDAGFNTVWFNYTTDPALLKDAVDQGFWLVPSMQIMANDSRLASAEGVRREMGRFSENDAVLFWHLGGTLAHEQAPAVARVAKFMKTIDPGRPLGADVWDGLGPYSRSLQLLGLHRWPLMTTLELSSYREWLNQRRQLCNPGTFTWTWIQTHMPDWYTYLLYRQSGATEFKEAVGPQAEQIRLLAYTAIGSGCRGLAFWSDRFLADSHFGRDRLLQVALLNQELDQLEPVLVTATEDPEWIKTSSEDVQAAVLRCPRGILVLPIWMGKGTQFVPAQSAASKLTVVVPQVPPSYRAFEVTPGDVHGLHTDRVVGGTKVTIPEFGLTTAVVFTSDFAGANTLYDRFQKKAMTGRQMAAQWTYDMALYELEKVLRVESMLERQGHTLSDAGKLIEDAKGRLRTAKQHWDNRLFSEAYRESQRALRPIRILMRAQWEQAVKGLDSPVSSPFAISFFTLPRHWEFMDQVNRAITTTNVLPGGDFEIIPERVQDSWRPEEPTLDNVEMTAQRVSEIGVPMTLKAGAVPSGLELPHQGKQCLMLRIRPKNTRFPPRALERTLLAITSPVVHLQPGTLVKISAWIRIPQPITASPDGALFYDSAGGEPLAIRLTEATPWKKITLFRHVPDSGTLHVTLAMTGLGSVYFDDVRIEPMVASGSDATTASRP